MPRTVKIYKAYEIISGVAQGQFKNGQVFKPLNNHGASLITSTLLDEDYAWGSLLIKDKLDENGHRTYPKAYVWDLHKDYEMEE